MPVDGDDRILRATNLTAREKVLIRGTRYYHFRQQILYSQARPTQIRLPRETTRLDCSGLVACCMDFARVLPKVDWRYTNTWVQIRFGRKVTLAEAKPGDVVFYGHALNDPSHEALFLGTLAQLKKLIEVPPKVSNAFQGNGPHVLSDGHFPMMIAHLDYRADRTQIRNLIGATS